jgi:hypothetical protein
MRNLDVQYDQVARHIRRGERRFGPPKAPHNATPFFNWNVTLVRRHFIA